MRKQILFSCTISSIICSLRAGTNIQTESSTLHKLCHLFKWHFKASQRKERKREKSAQDTIFLQLRSSKCVRTPNEDQTCEIDVLQCRWHLFIVFFCVSLFRWKTSGQILFHRWRVRDLIKDISHCHCSVALLLLKFAVMLHVTWWLCKFINASLFFFGKIEFLIKLGRLITISLSLSLALARSRWTFHFFF